MAASPPAPPSVAPHVLSTAEWPALTGGDDEIEVLAEIMGGLTAAAAGPVHVVKPEQP